MNIRFLFFIFSLFITCEISFAGYPTNQFRLFQQNEQLPSNSVQRIFHDKEGYIWFASKGGISRFDGYTVKTFRTSASTPGKLSSNDVQCIAEDNLNRIWVGTNEGINIIDKNRYSIFQVENPLIQKERINSILCDSKGNIWIGTTNNGVLKMNPETFEVEQFSADTKSKLRLNTNTIGNVYEDRQGNIWLCGWKSGLSYINKSNTEIRHLSKIGSNNNPFKVFQDNNDKYWICSWGDGLFTMSYDKKDKTFKTSQFTDINGNKTPDIVYSITQDYKNGDIWVVTFKGLNRIHLDKDGRYFLSETNNYFNDGAIRIFHEIITDQKGNLWLGSHGDGVYVLDFNQLAIENYALNEILPSANTSNISRIIENNDKELFFVINRVGLYHFDIYKNKANKLTDPQLQKITSISAIINKQKTNKLLIAAEGENAYNVFIYKQPTNPVFVEKVSLPLIGQYQDNTISALTEDQNGNLYIGTYNGLLKKTLNGDVEIITPDLRYINDIKIDKKNQIWVATEKNGVFYVVSENGKYKTTKVDLKIKNYESLGVQSIICRNNGETYISTKEGGIFVFDNNTNEVKEISGLYGITEEGILDILEDDLGQIWISTLKKIIRYNPETHASTYYSNSDGLIVSAFMKNSYLKLSSGKIMFGGSRGLSILNPVSLNQSTANGTTKKDVIITDILIQNKSIFDYINRDFFDVRKNKLVVKHAENNIMIEFSALDYTVASKIQYAYKMSGVDDDWNYVGNDRRFVNYADLPIGGYTFMVKASDENGVWSDNIHSIRITVLPPWYRSWWAYLFYTLTVAALAFYIYRTISNRIKLRNELRISQIEKSKTEELTQIKLRYFTNISHELLTPLTIIMLQIESLQKKIAAHTDQFDIMKENVLRLKRLIKQILIFRKTESGNMKLLVVQADIVEFVNNICRSNFKPQIESNDIQFKIDIEYEHYLAYFDPDKLDKAVYNILSNAFKHTPKGGTISLKMSFVPRKDLTIMRLSIADTGSGISEKDLPYIFNRFYISSASDQSQSHGIGLALTNDLLKIHKGSIEVKSQLGEGSIFTIEIPVSENAYTSEEMSPIDDAQTPDDFSDVEETDNNPESENITGEHTILIAEDNTELCQLIAEQLRENNYQVFTAENGLQALQVLREKEIDLIISDVMMPEMDGLTFCKILKNDVNTSHIHVLMLTAKNSPEDRIDCYNAGADAYIAKPFELGVLMARVKNLLNKRKQLTDSFKQNHEINITNLEYNSIDETFLSTAVTVIEGHLADEAYDFDTFAVEMSTSKSTLHRKLKSLTGLSPGEFIRNVRMKHAAQMMKNNIGNISEIAYAVGFNDPKYFSRCFKIEYGMTPKEYIDKHRKKM